jgi:hypothetical protein
LDLIVRAPALWRDVLAGLAEFRWTLVRHADIPLKKSLGSSAEPEESKINSSYLNGFLARTWQKIE